jgi:hydrogenase expression/formation protein HypC
VCLAVPGEVVSLHEREGLKCAKVAFGGITREVCLEYQPASQVGDFVLVHVGFAIATVDREEAARQWAVLKELGAAEMEEEGFTPSDGNRR